MGGLNFKERLDILGAKGNLRSLPQVLHDGGQISTVSSAVSSAVSSTVSSTVSSAVSSTVSSTVSSAQMENISSSDYMVNLSSNDYLALAESKYLRDSFNERCDLGVRDTLFSSSSSRLLTGNFEVYGRLERKLCEMYGREAALVFNSGYHANTGILPSVTTSKSLILADKLVHASLIDGIRLSAAKSIRYGHNNYEQLEYLVEKHAHEHDMVVVVSESIFSMDGDRADLERLVELKRQYSNVVLYVDEAHAVGAVGRRGLGCAEECGYIGEIDILVGTFGKALASVGAYVVCDGQVRSWLVNTMRTLIFTTALPPINLEWTLHVLEHIDSFEAERNHLQELGEYLRRRLDSAGSDISSSHIVPIIVGDSAEAILLAKALQEGGFYVLPVRPPTVPEGTSRLRVSLNSNITMEQIDQLVDLVKPLINICS